MIEGKIQTCDCVKTRDKKSRQCDAGGDVVGTNLLIICKSQGRKWENVCIIYKNSEKEIYFWQGRSKHIKLRT